MEEVVTVARRTVEVRRPRDIGDAIRVARKARGISQEELADVNAYGRFRSMLPRSGRQIPRLTPGGTAC
jgi:hypothetical protein